MGRRKKEEATSMQERNEDEGMDPEERGSERVEDVPVPTDADDDDITLGEFFNKRKGASEDFGDFGEELRKKGKGMREAATESTAGPSSSQKKAGSHFGEASGAGPSAGPASSSDGPISVAQDLEGQMTTKT